MLNRFSTNRLSSYIFIVLGVICCGGAIYNLPVNRLDWRFIMLVLITLTLASKISLKIPKSEVYLTATDALVFLTFLLYGGEAAILLAAADAATVTFQIRRQLKKISLRVALLLNTSSMAIATTGTYLVMLAYFKLVGTTPNYLEPNQFYTILFILTFAQFGFSSAIVAVTTSLTNKTNIWQSWNEKCFASALGIVLGAVIAAFLFKLFDYVDAAAFCVAGGFAILIYQTYSRYLKSIEREIKQVEHLEQKRKEDELEQIHASLHDPLTNLPNKKFFIEQVGLMLQRQGNRNAPAFCVMVLDLNRFKSVNDNLGHSIGDDLLINVGRRLENTVRREDGDMVARLGGDEYAVLLTNVAAPADAIRFAERIKETLAQPFKLNGHQVHAAASIGIVLNDHKYERPGDVLRDADIAMYRAKENKTGQQIFKLEMGVQASSILETERGLRDALANDELRVFYQPIVALWSGKLVGFEALMRWEHPTRGLVSPIDFIPVAEETGLIVPMTNWIMRESCAQLARWQARNAENSNLFVSVNLSSQHFAEPGLVEQVRSVLQTTKLKPHDLKLEITESVVMENAEETIRVMEKLCELGVRLSIDDFGTGYSSLSYLHQFPIDTLKVDRSFVSRIGKNGENAEIVRAVLALANSLELEVTAEGIETTEQLTTLRRLGCRFAQGYLMSRPQPQADIDRLIQEKTVWLPEGIEVRDALSANFSFLPEKVKNQNSSTLIIDSESHLTN